MIDDASRRSQTPVKASVLHLGNTCGVIDIIYDDLVFSTLPSSNIVGTVEGSINRTSVAVILFRLDSALLPAGVQQSLQFFFPSRSS